MNSQLESARHSSILQVAEEKATDVLEYSAKKDLDFPGILSRQTISMNVTQQLLPCIGNRAEGYIDLPKYGYMHDIVLEIDATGCDDASVGPFLRTFTSGRGQDFERQDGCLNPYELFDKFELKNSSGKVISTLPSSVIQDIISTDFEYYSHEYFLSDSTRYTSPYYSTMMNEARRRTSAGETDVGYGPHLDEPDQLRKLYLAIPFQCFQKFATCPDLMTLEQLQLVVTGSVPTKVSNVALFAQGITIHAKLGFFLPSPERHDALVKAQHPSGAPFNYINKTIVPEYEVKLPLKAWSWARAGHDAVEADQKCAPIFANGLQFLGTAHVELQVAQPVVRTFIHVIEKATGRRAMVSTVKVSDAGNILYETDSPVMTAYMSRKNSDRRLMGPIQYPNTAIHGVTGLLGVGGTDPGYTTGYDDVPIDKMARQCSDDTMQCAVVEWGLQKHFTDAENVSSAVSFHQMSNPTVEITAYLPPIKLAGIHNRKTNWPDKDEMIKWNKTSFKGFATGTEVQPVQQDYYLQVFHEVLQVTSVQPTANMRNRQIRVLGTR